MKEIYNSEDERLMAITILQDAEVLIEDRTHRYICESIFDSFRRRGMDPSPISYQLCAYIDKCLSSVATYGRWLEREFQGQWGGVYRRQEREGRLAWIADMIAALEKGEALPARPSLPPGFEWPKPLNVDLGKI